MEELKNRNENLIEVIEGKLLEVFNEGPEDPLSGESNSRLKGIVKNGNLLAGILTEVKDIPKRGQDNTRKINMILVADAEDDSYGIGTGEDVLYPTKKENTFKEIISVEKSGQTGIKVSVKMADGSIKEQILTTWMEIPEK